MKSNLENMNLEADNDVVDVENVDIIDVVDVENADISKIIKDWYAGLNGVKYSDWAISLFNYTDRMIELRVPSSLFINCMNSIPNSSDKLIEFIDDLLSKQENQLFESGKIVNEFFVKLESRSPKDYMRDYPNLDLLPCVGAKGIVDALLGSMRTFDDLVFLTKLKDEVIIYLKKFVKIPLHLEWRVFVKNRQVVGISQQFYNCTFEYSKHYIDSIYSTIMNFMINICIPAIHINDFVADLVVDDTISIINRYGEEGYEVKILETNPWLVSDACLFDKRYCEFKETLRYNKS